MRRVNLLFRNVCKILKFNTTGLMSRPVFLSFALRSSDTFRNKL